MISKIPLHHRWMNPSAYDKRSRSKSERQSTSGRSEKTSASSGAQQTDKKGIIRPCGTPDHVYVQALNDTQNTLNGGLLVCKIRNQNWG